MEKLIETNVLNPKQGVLRQLFIVYFSLDSCSFSLDTF